MRPIFVKCYGPKLFWQNTQNVFIHIIPNCVPKYPKYGVVSKKFVIWFSTPHILHILLQFDIIWGGWGAYSCQEKLCSGDIFCFYHMFIIPQRWCGSPPKMCPDAAFVPYNWLKLKCGTTNVLIWSQTPQWYNYSLWEACSCQAQWCGEDIYLV